MTRPATPEPPPRPEASQRRRSRATHPVGPSEQRTARTAGILLVITFLTSIPALLLYQPLLNQVDYITSGGTDTPVLFGVFLELVLIVANVGSAVVLFPVLKRQHEALALGYVTARVMESVFIAAGILSILAVVALRQDPPATGSEQAALSAVGRSLVAIKDASFLLGPGFVVGIGNGVILGYLMFRSGLIPRGLALVGLIGGTLICASGTAVLFGVVSQGGAVQSISTIPEFVWELALGIYLIVRGFRPAAITTDPQAPDVPPVTATVGT